MQRHAALAIPFGLGDVGTTEAATDVDADALGAHAHRRLHGALHGAAEGNAALELLGNALRDKIGIGFRLAHFNDVDVHFRRGELLHLVADLVDVSALLADHDARTGSVDRHAALPVRTLDDDLGNRRLLQFLLKHLADLQIFLQKRTIVGARSEPARIPGAVDTERLCFPRPALSSHEMADPCYRLKLAGCIKIASLVSSFS